MATTAPTRIKQSRQSICTYPRSATETALNGASGRTAGLSCDAVRRVDLGPVWMVWGLHCVECWVARCRWHIDESERATQADRPRSVARGGEISVCIVTGHHTSWRIIPWPDSGWRHVSDQKDSQLCCAESYCSGTFCMYNGSVRDTGDGHCWPAIGLQPARDGAALAQGTDHAVQI